MTRAAIVRAAAPADLPAIVEIHNHYVLHALTPFAEEPFAVEDRVAWLQGFDGARWRLLVAEDGGALLGWACSGRYRPTPAFDHTVESSVYVHPQALGRGVGALLYAALLDALRGEAVRTVVAGVAQPNPASVALHRRFGFEEVGTFRDYARKRGVWISSTWFQRAMA